MKLPRLTAQEIIKILEKKGFVLARQSGGHRIYRNEKGVRITVPFHAGKILHPKIIKSIMRDAEMNEDDFRKK
ncbi:MAG: type II toxin-antitoxin system HicA family toxin [Candidatus Aenigmarchaeota archaeon]|nr:type II toxin-antitoxin system HicA family toxin [Candidatus Aenigmarchaeota archaeon]